MDKKHLSKGHETTDFDSSTTSTPPSVWKTRPASVWALPVNRPDCLLVCGAFLVQQLRQDLREETGYTSSAGLAHTKILAKVASAMHKVGEASKANMLC